MGEDKEPELIQSLSTTSSYDLLRCTPSARRGTISRKIEILNCLCVSVEYLCGTQRCFIYTVMDDYRFNSETDPTDEQLQMLMQEAAQDARERYATAHKAYFAQIDSIVAAL